MEPYCIVISFFLSLFNTSGIYGVDDFAVGKTQHQNSIILPCDTLKIQQFLKLADTMYTRIDSFENLSDIEQRKMIRVYNSIFRLNSSLKNKTSIINFQRHFDSVIKNFIFENKQLIVAKNSAVFFPHLRVALLNDVVVRTNNYNCSDIYYIYD